eukprot:7089532-Prorocentrum_lima.AAC.1
MTSSLVGSEMCIRDRTIKPGEAEPGTSKSGEAEPFIKERDKFEEDQLLMVLHETSMPALEDQVAQVDKRLLS